MNFFTGEKARLARYVMRRYQRQFRGLRDLTDLELERLTVWYYGPCSQFGSYYTPTASAAGWDWQVDPTNRQQCINGIGYDYVERVYASIQ
ncbi:MAG TPA: hypothetical protein VFO89_02710 [Thermoanaerobaculia bacterium]|nr:hypothetical protein [Thermoanaerobaculia bacterium]